MKKKGFVLTSIIVVGLLAAGLYFGYDYFAKLPSAKTQEITKNFLKYPNAKSWLIVNKRSLCIYYFDGCTQTQSEIIFTTSDSWSNIFAFYRDSLESYGWITYTKVITSIPQVINFTGTFPDTYCEAGLVKPEEGETAYKWLITCFPK